MAYGHGNVGWWEVWGQRGPPRVFPLAVTASLGVGRLPSPPIRL